MFHAYRQMFFLTSKHMRLGSQDIFFTASLSTALSIAALQSTDPFLSLRIAATFLQCFLC